MGRELGGIMAFFKQRVIIFELRQIVSILYETQRLLWSVICVLVGLVARMAGLTMIERGDELCSVLHFLSKAPSGSSGRIAIDNVKLRKILGHEWP